MKRLPDSELEIMMIIWDMDKPVTRSEIEARLDRERKLSPTTVLSFLSRLQVQKSGKNNVYIARIDKSSYMQMESRSILKRLYQNSAKNFLAALYDGNSLSEDELRELEDYITVKRKGK